MSYTKEYRGKPVKHGNFETPAAAMARGVAVVRSGDTIALLGAGALPPLGFLNNEVTTDGPSYEEKMHIPESILKERKISENVIEVIYYEPGLEYITYGNVLSGTTFAVGEYVVIAADGEFTDEAGGSAGNLRIGRVQEIDVVREGQTGFVWKAEADLGVVAG